MAEPDSEAAKRPPLLAVVGPTAVGKTEVAVEVALRCGGEVVSADSMQVYRGLDIATDKPGPVQRRGVPHHCIDLVEPDEPFTVADYHRHARRAIAGIHARGRLPVLAGGSGLYVRAVVDDFLFPERGADTELRRRLQAEAEDRGNRSLWERLREVDPQTAARLHPNDRKRVIRALEVYSNSGRPLSEHLRRSRSPRSPYDVLLFGLTRPRAELDERIHARVERQLRAGLVAEVRRLSARGLDEGLTAFWALGYKEILGYLQGRYSLEEAVRILKRNTRRFARRQLSWFRSDPRVRWLDVSGPEGVGAAARAVAAAAGRRWPEHVE